MTSKEQAKKYRSDHPERTRLATKKWREKNKQKFVSIVGAWRKKNKKRFSSWWKEYNQRPDVLVRRKAVAKIGWAIKSGKIIRKEICEKCNKKSRTQAHHHDYSKPYDVVFLCRPCHCIEHSSK